jgi:hypothetical protein
MNQPIIIRADHLLDDIKERISFKDPTLCLPKLTKVRTVSCFLEKLGDVDVLRRAPRTCEVRRGRRRGGYLVQRFVFFGKLRDLFHKVMNLSKGSIFVITVQQQHRQSHKHKR